MSALSLSRILPLVSSPVDALLRRLSVMQALRRQRIALARLDAAALDDIGITEAKARAEASRPVWDVPATWIK